MDKQLQGYIETLEAEWAKPDGLLGKAREGHFDQRKAPEFITMLKKINRPAESLIDRRLVALLWYIPSFLGWQKERIAEKEGDTAVFEQFVNQVQGLVEEILGVP